MIDRSLWGHGLLAVVASAAAFLAWTLPRGKAGEAQVVVVQGSAERLTGVSFSEQEWDVTLVRHDERLEVTVAGKLKANQEAPPPLVSNEPPPASEPTPRPVTFPGSKQAKELVEKLAPLKAARSLGKLAGDKLVPLGLDKPSATLTLRFGDAVREVKVGNATYGSGDLYVMNNAGEVYLLPASSVAHLRHGASALLDRGALGIEKDQIERVTISAGAQGRELVQRNREDKAAAFFADAAEPDEKREGVGVWLDRVLRLSVVDLVDDKPTGPPALTVEVFGDKGTLGVVKLWPSGEKTAFLTSSRFGKTATVAKAAAEAISKELEKVLSEGR